MKIDEPFLDPEVLHALRAGDECRGAIQATQLFRSRLEFGCFLIRQGTRWDSAAVN
jgi:hypothetical protein